VSTVPLAHETWFVHRPESYPLEWSALDRPVVLVGLALVVGVAFAWRVAARWLPQPELARLGLLARLLPWVPRLLAIHLGASLLLLAFGRAVLDPGIVVGSGFGQTLLLVPEALAGLLLITGIGVPLAAYAVIAAGPVLLVLSGPQSLLTCLVLLGVAGFLIVLPPQPELGGRARLDGPHLRPALLLLRLGTAGSLLTLAVVEKLANPDMAKAIIAQEPVLNLLAPLRISAGDFVVVAGCIEVLFALLVLSGALPQVVALVAAVPFTASLLVFGGTELIGHLPVYGVLLTLLILGSQAGTSRAVSWWPGRSSAGLGRSRPGDSCDLPAVANISQ